MKRVWVVDDSIPVHALHYDGPLPSRFEEDVVRYLVEHVAADQWEEGPVLELCRALSGGDFTATFFLSPEQMQRALSHDATPPHAVIFDWEYPGSNDEANRTALDRLLDGAFVYVQIYTHLGRDAVEPKVGDLRDRYHGRLLPTKGKADVTPAQLREDILKAWQGTIAGELADKVRGETFAALERALIDMGGVSKDILAAMAQGAAENLLHVVLAKVRDEIGDSGFEALSAVLGGSQSADSTDAVRQLLSVWYYYFPRDDRVRRGDLIEFGSGDDLGFVITPPCDLVKFPKKTGRRLTWAKVVRLDPNGVSALQAAGIKIDDIGGSIISNHGTAGDTVILLPNVPLQSGSREDVADYAILCHGWENKFYEGAPGGELSYGSLAPFSRRCTVADPFASGIVSKIMSVISSPGTPDLPKGERVRLKTATAAQSAPATAAATNSSSDAASQPEQTGLLPAESDSVTRVITPNVRASPAVPATPSPPGLTEAAIASPPPVGTSGAIAPHAPEPAIPPDPKDEEKMS